MAFTYLKVKPAKCLCLFPVVLVLVLRIWSCLHHWLLVLLLLLFVFNLYSWTTSACHIFGKLSVKIPIVLIIEKLSGKTDVFFSMCTLYVYWLQCLHLWQIDEYVWHVNECGCCCEYNTTRASSCIYSRLFPHKCTYAYIWRLRKVILFQLPQLGNTWSEAITPSMFPGSGSTQRRWDGKPPEASVGTVLRPVFNSTGGKNSTFFFQLHKVVDGQKQFHSVHQGCALDIRYIRRRVSQICFTRVSSITWSCLNWFSYFFLHATCWNSLCSFAHCVRKTLNVHGASLDYRRPNSRHFSETPCICTRRSVWQITTMFRRAMMRYIFAAAC